MKNRFPLVLLFALLLPAPRAGDAREAAPAKIDEQAASAMAAANNAFAAELYGALRETEGNLLFSPYSIHSALLLAREGARTETAAQMDDVLHLGALARGAGFRALRDSLRPTSYEVGYGRKTRRVAFYELDVANAVWGQRRFFVKNTFLHPLRDEYGLPLRRVDFDQREAARRTVNDWAARNTRNRIRGILGRGMPRPHTRLMLANAVYYKANWEEEFNPSATKREAFTTAGGTKRAVPTMWQVDSHPYAEVDGVQVVELAYRGHRTSMVVFLPREVDGLAALEAKCAGGALGDWSAALSGRRVDLKLPRFEFESRFELSSHLATLGMPLAFDEEKADLSAVTDREQVWIGGAAHMAWVAVDEEGTEAAAVTAVDACAAEAAPAEPVSFHADHPFLFLIRHRPTGAILFLGRVVDPAP